MKINIKQEGGFIGMASKAKLDFDKLTEDEQKMLDSIAQKAGEKPVVAPTESDAVPPSPRDMSPARDMFSYSLSMKKDGKKVDMAFDDTNAPPELVALFQKYIQI